MNHNNERASLYLVCLITLVGYLGASIAYPILPVMLMHSSDNSILANHISYHWRTIWLGLTLAMYPLGQFIGAPCIGAASDRFGRKRVLITTMLAATIGYLFTILAISLHNLTLLILSRFITGLMEGNIAIARSIAIDLKTIPKQVSLGRINAISAIGYIVGPLLGGVLSDPQIVHSFNFATPFYLATLTTLSGAAMTAWRFKESHQATNKQIILNWQELNIVRRVNNLCQNSHLRQLLIACTVFTLAVDIYYEFGPVYLTSQWNMSTPMIALYNLVLSTSLAIGSLLPHRLSKWISVNAIVRSCVAITAILLLLMTVHATPTSVLILFGLSGLSITLVTVNLTVQLSDSADNNIQGEVMGTQLGLRMLGDGITCLLAGLMMIHSAATPLIISSLIAACALLSLRTKKTISGNNHPTTSRNPLP